MKFYCSSYEIGLYGEQLAKMFDNTSKKIAYIPNALDASQNIKKVEERKIRDLNNLKHLGLFPEYLDLKDYFGKQKELALRLSKTAGVFISGGNTFVLRQAFALSGFDIWIQNNLHTDFIYAGYSAACCILSPTLTNLQIVDDSTLVPYDQCNTTIWEGLGILPYSFFPHYKSDHHESEDIDKEIEYSIVNKFPFVAYRDGEVLIFQKH